MKPILLLDVDGVLNPLTNSPANPDFDFDIRVVSSPESGGFPLALSTKMGLALSDLLDQVEIRWLTTWVVGKDEANPEIGSRLGLPRLPVAPLAWFGDKMASVQQVLDEDRRVIWIDDHIPEFFRDGGFDLSEDIAPTDRLLCIAPDSRMGLRAQHFELVAEWLNEQLTSR